MTNAFPLWLSLLGHVLFFLFFLIYWVPKALPVKEKYLPAYVYHEDGSLAQAVQQQTQSPSAAALAEKKADVSLKPQQVQTQMPSQAVAASNYQNPVHLIGDKKLDKPLIKLLAKALSAHLVYPKIAIDFNLHGMAYVGFQIHPNGEVTDVQLIKSSGTDVLDRAALAGVVAMSPLKNVDLYLKNPEFTVVGIIFR